MGIISTIFISAAFLYMCSLYIEYCILNENKKLNPVYVASPKIKTIPKKPIIKEIDTIQKTQQTSQSNIDLVVSGLVKIGVKRIKARDIVMKMCKNNYYDDAQKLFEACFPYINS